MAKKRTIQKRKDFSRDILGETRDENTTIIVLVFFYLGYHFSERQKDKKTEVDCVGCQNSLFDEVHRHLSDERVGGVITTVVLEVAQSRIFGV